MFKETVQAILKVSKIAVVHFVGGESIQLILEDPKYIMIYNDADFTHADADGLYSWRYENITKIAVYG